MYLFGPLSPPCLPAAHLRCLHTLHGGQGDQGAGWQAGRPTKCQGSRLVTQAWKVFLRLANLRPWFFFLVSNPFSPEPLQLHRATSFALKNGQSVCTSCCGRARRGKYAQESDSMTRRVNRFTNTTKLAIYKSSELRGNYWWVFWRMDKWQRWTIHCQPNPLTGSNAWFCHFELHPKIVPREIFPFECIISMFSYNVSKGCIPNVKVAHSWHRSNIVKLKGFASFCVRKSRITISGQ